MKRENPRVEEIVVANLSEYLRGVDAKCADSKVLFRGQTEDAEKHRSLLPRIARGSIPPRVVLAAEKRMFSEFKRTAVPFLGGSIPNNDWEWMTLAQHHGLPTRLLDWTHNSMAALWFAMCRRPRTYRTYGLVWLFAPAESDFVDTATELDPLAVSRTMVLEPAHIARRIAAQSACFTVHKYLAGKSRFIPLDRNKTYIPRLSRVRIPGEAFPRIQGELDRCGVNSATLFSDLDHLCEYITWENGRSADKPSKHL